MSFLPLSEGTEIREILFYDHDEHNEQSREFAMSLSITEIEKLVCMVMDFYRDSDIGKSDKTKQMENAEKRIRKLLERC